MKTISVQQPINLRVVRFELDFSALAPDPKPETLQKRKKIKIPKVGHVRKCLPVPPPPPLPQNCSQKKDVKDLVEALLDELYAEQRAWSSSSGVDYSQGSTSVPSLASTHSNYGEQTDAIERSYLESLGKVTTLDDVLDEQIKLTCHYNSQPRTIIPPQLWMQPGPCSFEEERKKRIFSFHDENNKGVLKNIDELKQQVDDWEYRLQVTGERLAKSVRVRDRLKRQQKRICAAFTVLLRHITGETGARFGVGPSGGGEGPGEGGYAEWLHAMRLVARLPAGVPQHFRKKLWLTLAESHLTARGVEWSSAERACFRGTAQPDDTELGAQILKDLHRTGCSLFCGTEGRENQAMLRRVLLAYARWNKDVGYCQGFNMLAAIILEVMEKSESDSLKVMIYLVEAVLPEGYFADDLRGLSADMAAFRDLLRLRLPRLANHMDHLQRISDGGGVEPPLPDVFTMQWFLTLYATWLPRECLLRIWDLVLLDGNEILLLTALAIWDMLQDRILSARSADEFYSCMGGGAGEVWAAGDALVARVVAFGSAPELPRLRSLHRYRVAPPAPPSAPVYQPPLHSAMQSMTKRGLRLFYSEDEGDSSDDGNKLALATVIPRREDRLGAGDRLSLDIGALKRQYARLRERQRQAHVILAAACARHAAVGVPTSPTSLTVNNLLLGKNAIVSSRGRRLGPPPGAIPPSRLASSPRDKTGSHSHDRPNETISWNEEKNRKSLSRRNSVKWKDIKKENVKEKIRKASIDLEEAGDGIIVSELEANEMIASLRSRSSSETSSYSSRSASSTDTSLCDDKENASDSETDLLDDDKGKDTKILKSVDKTTPSQMFKDKKVIQKSSDTKKVVIKHSPDQDINISTINPAKDITDYLDSAAGEPLRTYIDGFESKLKDSVIDSSENSLYKPISPFKPLSPCKLKESIISSSENNIYKPISPFKSISPFCTERSEVLQKLNRMNFQEIPDNNELFRPTKLTRVSKNLTDLSPVDLSPCNYSMDITSPRDYDFDSNFMTTRTMKSAVLTRPPDIIDSFTMYPNFVPDIDLSDKNVSDVESPPRSPDAESIIVSEDEPPIQLKIDKYFEHSPEFFGARVTDPNNSDIPNRRPVKRHSRLPKKPDSLTLHMSSTEKLLKHDVERASSLPQSHSFNETVTPSTEYMSSANQKETKNFASEQKVETPEQNVKTPEEKLKSSEQNVKTPEKSLRTPEQKVQTPELNIKTPEANLDTPEQKIRTPEPTLKTSEQTKDQDIFSPKDYILRSGRKNSERALQIIQENSKILSRILTKQNRSESNHKITESKDATEIESDLTRKDIVPEKTVESKLLKESSSDSLIGYRKRNSTNDANEKNDFTRIRPISIDDPFSLEVRNPSLKSEESNTRSVKTPRNECLGNKTDFYGWENKGFLAKCDFKSYVPNSDANYDYEYKKKNNETIEGDFLNNDVKPVTTSEWARHSFSGDSRTSITLPSSERKDTSSFDKRLTSEDYNYPFSSKYNDFVLSKASDICSKIVDKELKVCENLSKTDNSQVSDFANVVTSSISFTYEPSVEDDSPMGAKSNSSDTLCQITSLDQVSTPISPKIFPRETPTLPKDILERNDKTKVESDDTCSAITSLIETDTLSSLSYPRSPSTGSYHPFPTRPAMRMPKELGVRLGMYPKDTVSSPQK